MTQEVQEVLNTQPKENQMKPTRVTSKHSTCPTCKSVFRRYWLKSSNGQTSNMIRLCPTCRREWTLKRIYLDLENLAHLESLIKAWEREGDIIAKISDILTRKE